MNFIKTQKMLTQQAEQKQIPLESALELLRTYLTELRYHTGTSVDRCGIGNMTQVIANLAAVSNDILFVYRTNEKEILEAENRFTQALIKAQTSCGEYHSRIAQLDEQIRQGEGDLARLEALQQQENSRNAVLAQLRQQTAQLQAQLDALSSTNQETEAGRLKNLLEDQTRELSRLQAEYAQMQQTHSLQKGQLEAENHKLTQLRTQLEEDFTKLQQVCQAVQSQDIAHREQKQTLLTQEQALLRLEEETENLRHISHELAEKVTEAETRLALQNQENRLTQTALEEKLNQKQALEAVFTAALAQSQALEQQHADLEADNAALTQQISHLQQSIGSIREAGGQLLDQLNALKGMQEKIQTDYEDACQLHRERQLAFSELEDKLALQNQENAALQEMTQEKDAQLTQLSALHQQKLEQLQTLNAEVDKLENRLQNMQEDASRRRAEIAATEEALAAERQEFDQLLEQQVALNVDLEAQKTDNQNFRDTHLEPIKTQLGELVLQTRNDRAQLDELKNSIRLLEDNRTTTAQENALLMLQLKSRQASLDKVLDAYQQNKQAVALLEEDLRVKGSESAALLEKEKELRELLDEKNVARITAELESCNQKLEEDIRRAEQTEKDLAQKQHRIQTLQDQLSVVQAELADCRSKEKTLLQSHEAVTAELDRITCPENRKYCEKLFQQMQLMQALRDQLLDRLSITCGEGFALPEQLQQQLEEAEQAILSLRHVIREYTGIRQNSLENCQ